MARTLRFSRMMKLREPVARDACFPARLLAF